MRGRPLALIIALAVMPLLAGSDLRSGESRHPAQYACPPDDGPGPDYPDCGVSGKTVAVIGLGLGLLGYVFGRASAPVPPGKDKVKEEVEKVFADRKGEATKHGVSGAIPLLDQARDDVLAALRRLGVI